MIRPLLLSHHPGCDHFAEDVFNVGKHKLCIGCFVSYPVALSIVALWLLGFFQYPYATHFLIGIPAGLVQLLSYTKLSDRKAAKIVMKLCLGIGFGFATLGIFTLPILLWQRVWVFVNMFLFANSINYLRYRKIQKTCDVCEYAADFSRCPGFEDMKHFVSYYGPPVMHPESQDASLGQAASSTETSQKEK